MIEQQKNKIMRENRNKNNSKNNKKKKEPTDWAREADLIENLTADKVKIKPIKKSESLELILNGHKFILKKGLNIKF